MERKFSLFGELVVVRRTKQLAFFHGEVEIEWNAILKELGKLFFNFDGLKAWSGSAARRCSSGVKKAALNICRLGDVGTFFNLRARVFFIFNFTNAADARVICDLCRLRAEL